MEQVDCNHNCQGKLCIVKCGWNSGTIFLSLGFDCRTFYSGRLFLAETTDVLAVDILLSRLVRGRVPDVVTVINGVCDGQRRSPKRSLKFIYRNVLVVMLTFGSRASKKEPQEVKTLRMYWRSENHPSSDL